MRKISWSAAILLGLAVAMCQSSLAFQLPTTERYLVALSHYIIEGKVTGEHSYWGPNREQIYTDYQIEILTCVKGKPRHSTVTVKVTGVTVSTGT